MVIDAVGTITRESPVASQPALLQPAYSALVPLPLVSGGALADQQGGPGRDHRLSERLLAEESSSQRVLRVLICDDEPLAASRLSALLAALPGVEVVASALDGADALACLRTTSPDLALLSLDVPGGNGPELVKRMALAASEEDALVAFVNALPRFAADAFDSGALDFLTKPLLLSRLERTIARAREMIEGRDARHRLLELRAGLRPFSGVRSPPWRDTHVWVTRRGEAIRVDLDEVERVTAEGAYVGLHLTGASFLHREPIGSIERRLDHVRFVRVHRSHILRMDQVASVRRTRHGAAELVLRSGHRVPLGRRYAKEARRLLFGSAGPITGDGR